MNPDGVAHAAWYTARMPWLRNAHRHTKTRWTLTVLAMAFLALWIVGGWWSFEVLSSSKRAYASFSGGNVTLMVYPAPTEGRVRKPSNRWNDRWSTSPATLHARLTDWRYVRFTCTLLVPAMVLGLAAAFLWYRRSKPFSRPDRPNRSRQFKKTCWTLTIVAPILFALSIFGQWFRVAYQGPRLTLQLERGMVFFYHPSYRMAPHQVYSGWQVDRVVTVNVPGAPRQVTIGGNAFHGGFGRDLSVEGTISLKFLAACFATIAGTFWFIRLRPYPPGRCPTCQYDLNGLAASTPCPECGHTRAPA